MDNYVINRSAFHFSEVWNHGAMLSEPYGAWCAQTGPFAEVRHLLRYLAAGFQNQVEPEQEVVEGKWMLMRVKYKF